MRIVDRTTFLGMPAGTVYVKWGSAGQLGPAGQDFTWDRVAVKGETTGADWVVHEMFDWPEDCHDTGDWIDAMGAAIKGTPTAPLRIGDGGGRDGQFDQEQLFAVFNRVEVERLLAMLRQALEDGY